MTTVRKPKSGDQLTVGDWLAPGELLDGAAEVLFAHAYPASADGSRGNDGKHVLLAVREQGGVVASGTTVAGGHLFDLASDEDLAELREQAERTQKIAEIRALATWLEERPWLPLPSLHANHHVRNLDGYRQVMELAARPGAILDTHLDDRTKVDFREGPLCYSLIAWHDDGRPAGPAPEPRPDFADGPCEDPDCPNASWIHPASADLAELDPTGLAYTRADDGADDPTPVSGGRIEPHTGAVTDGGLVDETEAQPYLGWDGPCPASLHIPEPGQTCGVCGAEDVRSAQHIEVSRTVADTYSIECSCGAGFGGFDTADEAQAALTQHVKSGADS